MKWLKEGDKNTDFFHQVLKTRSNKTTISNIQLSDGSFSSYPTIIQNVDVDFFSQIFGSISLVNNIHLLSFIPSLVSESDNEMLMAMSSSDEIQKTIFLYQLIMPKPWWHFGPLLSIMFSFLLLQSESVRKPILHYSMNLSL